MKRLGVALAIALATLAEPVAAATAPAFVPALREGDAVPALPLVDQSGRPFSFGDLRGNVVIVSFIYTRCGDARMCPLVSAKFARMQRAIGNEPIRLVALTLDPRFDTPAVLRRYGLTYGQDPARWTLATGTPAWVDELVTRFGIATQSAQPGVILHTEAAIILDRDQRVAKIVDGNAWSPAELLALARGVDGSRAAPLAAIVLWLSGAVALCGRGATAFSGAGVLGLLTIFLVAIGWTFVRAFRGGAA